MDLTLTFVSLSSFVVLIAAWVALPNSTEESIAAQPVASTTPAVSAA